LIAFLHPGEHLAVVGNAAGRVGVRNLAGQQRHFAIALEHPAVEFVGSLQRQRRQPVADLALGLVDDTAFDDEHQHPGEQDAEQRKCQRQVGAEWAGLEFHGDFVRDHYSPNRSKDSTGRTITPII
jgi:hypothetical protein